MALTSGPNTGILEDGAVGEQHYLELMRQWRWLDFFLNPNIVSMLATPPGAPVNGQTHIVAASPTGAWVGKTGQIARWTSKLTVPAWEYITPKEGFSMVYNVTDKLRYQYNGTTWVVFSSGSSGGGGGGSNDFVIPASDLSTALTTGTGKAYAPAPRAGVIQGVKANLSVASSSGLVTVDIKKNGVSILTTLLTIDVSELTSVTAATAAVLDATKTTLVADDIISIDITGAGAGAKGLVITLLFAATPGVGTITEATTARNIANSDAGCYLRFTATGAKTCTFRPNSVHALPQDGEWTIANRAGAGDLTLVFTAPAAGNAPNGGTLILQPGMTVTVKRYQTDGFDVMGQTV